MRSYAAGDTGGWALAAFKQPEQWLGKPMRVASEFITTTQLASQFTAVTGKPARVVNVPYEHFAKSGVPGAEELVLNMKFFEAHQSKSGVRDVALSHKLYPQALTWTEFLKANPQLWQNL